MKRILSKKWLVLIAVLLLAKCKVPYDPAVKSSKDHYLVVEGTLNPNGFTNIMLSRTRNISRGDTAAYINETNAKVEIEDNANNIYPLNENGFANYSGNYSLNTYNKYRLRITTADNKEYVSDFVSCKLTPEIDNIGWNFKEGDVQVFVNTHDPSNNTRYYRWEYTETWEFHSQYYSNYQYNTFDSTVSIRQIPVYVCYRSQNSTNIILGSSAKLQKDVVHEAPIVLIPNHDKRISVLYSILVTQYALDSAGYNYWNAMRGNTENVGSIFDSQPNQTVGNIHCISDSMEMVIGYVGAGTSTQSRFFISNSSMLPSWNLPANCIEKDVPQDSIVYFFGTPGGFTPVNASRTGYNSASISCVDCTLSGSPVKPPFWP